MDKILLKQKLKAFAYHLLINFFVALISLLLVYWVWYPSPLAKATGVNHVYQLILFVDMILGPILTFIVFKKPKKTLKFDLAIIFIFQLSALFYGLYTVYQGKPAWIAYDVDRFQLVRINEIDQRNISEAKNEYKYAPLFQPKYVTSKVPKENISLSNQILFDEVFNGITPPQRPELYIPLDSAYPQIMQKAKDLKLLNQYNDQKKVIKILDKYPQADSFVPLKANAIDMTVLIDKKSGGKVVAIVDLRPW